MLTREKLVEEFRNTLEFNQYDDILETHVYTEQELDNIKLITFNKNEVCITKYNDTVTEILESDGYIAALNFADGYNPGGLVLDGARTQEESLCRSSNLYKSLILQDCKELYYDYNKSNKEFNQGKCSDRIIYTKNAIVFRDNELNWLDENEYKLCDIITCPAPFAGRATDDEIMHRMNNIIKVAELNRVNKLILGCWGCGAFGNDWKHFSKLWFKVINNIDRSCTIIMATRDKDFLMGRWD